MSEADTMLLRDDLAAETQDDESQFCLCHLLLFSTYASIRNLREGLTCVREVAALQHPDAIALDAALSTVALIGKHESPAKKTAAASRDHRPSDTRDAELIRAHARRINSVAREQQTVQMHALLGYWHLHGVGGIPQSCMVASDHYFQAAEISIIELAATGSDPLPLPLLYEMQVMVRFDVVLPRVCDEAVYMLGRVFVLAWRGTISLS